MVGCSSMPIPNTIDGSFQPNSWLQILPDNRIVFQLEMEQGVYASLPVLTAEELDVDPAKIEIQLAGTHPDFGNPLVLSNQTTGGSTSIPSSWDRLREAGAAAKAMLVAASADHWSIDASAVQTVDAVLTNTKTGETMTYIDTSKTAAKFSKAKYKLKALSQYKLIGKSLLAQMRRLKVQARRVSVWICIRKKCRRGCG